MYKRIPTVVFYVLDEWTKSNKPSPRLLEVLIGLFFEDNRNTELPNMALAMLAKLEIMNKGLLNMFSSNDKLVADHKQVMAYQLYSDRWGTFQLGDELL